MTRFTASQCARPGFSRNCESIETAKVMLGRVATDTYMRLQIASRYGTFPICASSVVSVGMSERVYDAPGTIGVAYPRASCRPNQARTESIYSRCDNETVLFGQSWGDLDP
jgi:hypothetical protein